MSTVLLLALLVSPSMPIEQEAVVTTYILAERGGVNPGQARLCEVVAIRRTIVRMGEE
jgi:hypothetical protein